MPFILILAACALSGPSCRDTCTRLYGQGEGECGIQRPGRTQEELLDFCVDECSAVAFEPGELGDYDPYEPSSGPAASQPENNAQVLAWAECIEAATCEDLQQGEACFPIY